MNTELSYPSHKVSVGDTWNMPKDDFNKIFGRDSQVESGSGSLTLIEVLDYKNKKHALINAVIKVKLAEDEKGFTMEMSMEGKYYRNLEDFIDVDFEMKGLLKASGERSTSDKNKMSILMEGPTTITSTRIINP